MHHVGFNWLVRIQIRASDQWIRIRLWILLYSSLTFKTLTKTIIFPKVLLLITFWRYIYIMFLREKVIKKSQHSTRNQRFYYFCFIIEGSGSLTNGSGSPILIRNLVIFLRKWTESSIQPAVAHKDDKKYEPLGVHFLCADTNTVSVFHVLTNLKTTFYKPYNRKKTIKARTIWTPFLNKVF